jgi:hypothetical protein
VSTEEPHVALPKLYGAPAYARPPAVAPPVPRPFDPDQLPLESNQTEEERESATVLRARAYEAGGPDRRGDEPDGSISGWLRPRLFSIRVIAGRLLGGD